MTQNKNRVLGRGLDAIFGTEDAAQIVVDAPKKTQSNMEEIAITLISPNPKQPRTTFDEVALGELAESIRIMGVIQPITVKAEGDKYIIISGERRFRASQLAGLSAIPAYIRQADDQAMHEMALVENIQRQDLNPMDVAMSLQRLIEECNLTQDALAGRVGKKRSTVANYMRLLKLTIEVQYALRDELITMGHAKAIGALEDGEKQLWLLKKVLKKSLSVRQTEALAAKAAQAKTVKEIVDEEFPETYTRLVEHLERVLTQNIAIKKSKKGGGTITIGFSDDKDIANFISKFEKIK